MKITIIILFCCFGLIKGANVFISDCSDPGIFCANTNQCNSKKIIECFGPGKGLIVDCADKGGFCKFVGPAINSMRPGNCSAEIPLNSDEPPYGLCNITPEPSDFHCFNEGFVPDPTNCLKYYHCKKDIATDSLKADLYTCPGEMMYNKADKQCNLYYNVHFCKTVTCDSNNENIKLMYNTEQYWSRCIEKNQLPYAIAGGCPDGTKVDRTSVFLPPKCI